MRRYQQSHSRALNSTIQTLFKVRKELGERTEEPAFDAGVPGVEAPVGDAPALATMEPFDAVDVGASVLSERACVAGLRPQPRERARKRRCYGPGSTPGRPAPAWTCRRPGCPLRPIVSQPSPKSRRPCRSSLPTKQTQEPADEPSRQNKPKAGRARADRRAGCRSERSAGRGVERFAARDPGGRRVDRSGRFGRGVPEALPAAAADDPSAIEGAGTTAGTDPRSAERPWNGSRGGCGRCGSRGRSRPDRGENATLERLTASRHRVDTITLLDWTAYALSVGPDTSPTRQRGSGGVARAGASHWSAPVRPADPRCRVGLV